MKSVHCEALTMPPLMLNCFSWEIFISFIARPYYLVDKKENPRRLLHINPTEYVLIRDGD